MSKVTSPSPRIGRTLVSGVGPKNQTPHPGMTSNPGASTGYIPPSTPQLKFTGLRPSNPLFALKPPFLFNERLPIPGGSVEEALRLAAEHGGQANKAAAWVALRHPNLFS